MLENKRVKYLEVNLELRHDALVRLDELMMRVQSEMNRLCTTSSGWTTNS